LSYEGYDYGQNRDPKKFRGKREQKHVEYRIEYEILFCSMDDGMRFIK